MSFFDRLSQLTVTTEDSLLRAAQGYRPTRGDLPGKQAFWQWTQRIAVQGELASARELSGLSNEELQRLADAFLDQPRYRRTDRLRYAFPAAFFLGCLALLFVLLTYGSPDRAPGTGLSGLTMLAIAACGAAFTCVTVGTVGAFQQVSSEMAHVKLGLYVGELNEQHPWLYETYLLLGNSAANQYRRAILADRGVLRGMDYLMMREIGAAYGGIDLTKPARVVAKAVQHTEQPLPGAVAVPPAGEGVGASAEESVGQAPGA